MTNQELTEELKKMHEYIKELKGEDMANSFMKRKSLVLGGITVNEFISTFSDKKTACLEVWGVIKRCFS